MLNLLNLLKSTNLTNFADLQGKRPAAGENFLHMGSLKTCFIRGNSPPQAKFFWSFEVPKYVFYKVKWPAAGEKKLGFGVGEIS